MAWNHPIAYSCVSASTIILSTEGDTYYKTKAVTILLNAKAQHRYLHSTMYIHTMNSLHDLSHLFSFLDSEFLLHLNKINNDLHNLDD